MTKQHCGTCRWYEQAYGEDCLNCGYCTWADKRAMPSCMEDSEWSVYANDGQLCQMWLAKIEDIEP